LVRLGDGECHHWIAEKIGFVCCQKKRSLLSAAISTATTNQPGKGSAYLSNTNCNCYRSKISKEFSESLSWRLYLNSKKVKQTKKIGFFVVVISDFIFLRVELL
jgi:DNA-binding transcriptional regulator YdaS (Cro superfamily)